MESVGLGQYGEYLTNKLLHSNSSCWANKAGSFQFQQSQSPVPNNLSDLIERTFLMINRDLNCKISIEAAEKLFVKLNSQMGKIVARNNVMEFFTLLDINCDGNIDLSEFKRAFISTI